MRTKTILLTGGAGYVGSHAYLALVNSGYEVILLDNFINSHYDVLHRLEKITGFPVTAIDADVRDQRALMKLFCEKKIDAVVHFAALKAVSESVKRPLDYFDVNVAGLINLIQVMQKVGCKRLVFSSSATVYGMSKRNPIPEDTSLRAANPYGQTKITGEQILNCMANSDKGWRFGILRYFNPAGAHSSGLIGEDPRDVPNNLMPCVGRVATGELPHVSIFGNDYNTPDGTCIRDYIHIEDLARGHVLSLVSLFNRDRGHIVNLGSGRGYSVLEVISAYSEVVGFQLPYVIAPRRKGDVQMAVAANHRAFDLLGFKAEKTLTEMCESSWGWVTRAHVGRGLEHQRKTVV